MLKINQYNCDLFSKRYLDCMLPQSHILLDIKKLVSFSFVTEEVKDLYSNTGRGSIDPTRMFKMLFLMFFNNIPSERELVEQVQVNVLYRYFCDINLDESIPDHSTKSLFRTFEVNDYYDVIKRAELLNKTKRYKEAAKIRILSTEPKFAEAKCYHGLRRFRYRGLTQVTIQAILTAICINIKRVARIVMARLRTPAFEEALAYR